MSEIKPCPFCGSKAEVNTGSFGEKFVTCSDDNCGGRLGTGIWSTTDERAIELWNERERDLATAQARIKELEAQVHTSCEGCTHEPADSMKYPCDECCYRCRCNYEHKEAR